MRHALIGFTLIFTCGFSEARADDLQKSMAFEQSCRVNGLKAQMASFKKSRFTDEQTIERIVNDRCKALSKTVERKKLFAKMKNADESVSWGCFLGMEQMFPTSVIMQKRFQDEMCTPLAKKAG